MILDFQTLAQWEQDLYTITQTVAQEEWEQNIPLNLPFLASQQIIINKLPYNYIIVNIRGTGQENEQNTAARLGLNWYDLSGSKPFDLSFAAGKWPVLIMIPDNYDAVVGITNTSDPVVTTSPTIGGTIKFGWMNTIRQLPFDIETDS